MIATLDDARQLVSTIAEHLDPHSRYIAELGAVLDASSDVGDFERRLLSGCRGQRHAGADLFAAMSLADKIRCNLITAETALFRFAEGEIEASREVLAARAGQPVRVLVVPCSHGEEAFTVAAFLLAEGVEFSIDAFDIQATLIDEARTGRLTFGYPIEHLRSPGYVATTVLERIEFGVGDAFALPLPPERIFDLVLCRNFLGYFRSEHAASLTRDLAARVAPGGRLFIDSFCLGKTSGIGRALSAAGLEQVDHHPVYARRAIRESPS